MSDSGRIDLHAHFVPEVYRTAALAAGHEHPDGMPAIPAWSPHAALEAMDRLGVHAACVSISSPGVHLGRPDGAVDLARRVNDAGAELVAAHPARFGLFASLPLPDVDAALTELEFSLDQLGADGVVLMTNAAGVYLGDPVLEPLWQEMSRRGTVVALHPTAPGCVPAMAVDRPLPLMEFLFDTTRSVTDLVLSGTLERNPGARVIVPHAGAALPAMAHRIAVISERLLSSEPGSADVLGALRRLWYDTAGFPLPAQLSALLHVGSRERLVWGSDWPFTLEPAIAAASAALDATDLLSAAERAALLFGNAARLLPRLASRMTG